MISAFLGGAGAAVAFMLTMAFCNFFKSKKEDVATGLLRERNELTRETNEYLGTLARACHNYNASFER